MSDSIYLLFNTDWLHVLLAFPTASIHCSNTDWLHMLLACPIVSIHCSTLIGWYVTCISNSINSLFNTDWLHRLLACPTESIHCSTLIGCICCMHFQQYKFIVQHWLATFVTCMSDSINSLFNTDWLHMLLAFPTVSIHCYIKYTFKPTHIQGGGEHFINYTFKLTLIQKVGGIQTHTNVYCEPTYI